MILYFIFLGIIFALYLIFLGYMWRSSYSIPADVTVELFKKIPEKDIKSLSNKVWIKHGNLFTYEEKRIMSFVEVHHEKKFPKAPFS